VLAPTTITYTPDGRVESISRSTGGETRTVTLTYDPVTRLLAQITDPLLRVTDFTAYDAATRVTALTLPGPRAVGFGYDAAGNVTTVTPPGRLAHLFEFTGRNQEESYLPPEAAAPTTYTYTLDRQLHTINRPEDAGAAGVVRTHDPVTGRLTTLATPHGAATYIYDTTGRLDILTAPGCSTCTPPLTAQTLTTTTTEPSSPTPPGAGPSAAP